MWRLLNSAGKFAYRNRVPLTLTVALSIGAAIYFNLASPASEDYQEELVLEQYHKIVDDDTKQILMDQTKHRLDVAALHFYPALRLKVMESLNIQLYVTKLKEFGANKCAENKSQRDDLWDLLKIDAMAMIFAATYMLSALTISLHIHLHLIAKSIALNESGKDSQFLQTEVFRIIADAIYNQLFEVGLPRLLSKLRYQISKDLSDWTVENQLAVKFEDFTSILSELRIKLEGNSGGDIAKDVFCGMSESPTLREDAVKSVSDCASTEFASSSSSSSTHGNSSLAQSIAAAVSLKAGKVLLGAHACSAFTECNDAIIAHMTDQLLRQTFAVNNPAGHVQRRPYALAALLPKLKNMCASVMPCDAAGYYSMRPVLVGPVLSYLCMELLDNDHDDN